MTHADEIAAAVADVVREKREVKLSLWQKAGALGLGALLAINAIGVNHL